MDKNYFKETGLTKHVHEHRHSYRANTSVEFLGPRDKEEFEQNLKNHPDNSSLKYYQDNPINYVHNNLGFRSNFDYKKGDKGNLYLGCSHTFGEGLHIEDTWSYKVNEKVGGNYINLGVPGTGMQTGARLLLTYLEYFDVQNVFVYYPHVYRFEYYHPYTGNDYENWFTCLPHHGFTWPGLNKQALSLLLEVDYAVSSFVNSFYSIVGQCQSKGIPVYFGNLATHFNFDKDALKARDLTHYSTTVHDCIACDMVNKFKSKKIPGREDLSVEFKHLIRDEHNKTKLL